MKCGVYLKSLLVIIGLSSLGTACTPETTADSADVQTSGNREKVEPYQFQSDSWPEFELNDQRWDDGSTTKVETYVDRARNACETMGLKTDFIWHEEILFAECRVVVKPSDATSCRKVFVISPRLKGDPLDVHRHVHFEEWDSAEKRWLSSSSSLLCPGTRTTFQCPHQGFGYPDGPIVTGRRCVKGLWK